MCGEVIELRPVERRRRAHPAARTAPTLADARFLRLTGDAILELEGDGAQTVLLIGHAAIDTLRQRPIVARRLFRALSRAQQGEVVALWSRRSDAETLGSWLVWVYGA